MYCSRCGTNNADGANFCQTCGNALMSGGPSGFAFSDNPAVAAIREVAGSTKYLVAVILFSVSILLSLIASISGASSAAALISSYANQYSYELEMSGIDPYMIDNAISGVSGGSVTSAIIGQLIPILMAVSLWLIYAASKKQFMSATGLKILKILNIISVVGYVLLYVVLAVICFALMALLNEYGESTGIAIGALVAVVLCTVYTIFYYIKLIKTIMAGEKAMRGDGSGVFSMFIAVMLFITAVISGLSGIVTNIGSVFGLLNEVVSAVCTFLFGMILLDARHKMEAVNAGIYQAPAQDMPYGAQMPYLEGPAYQAGAAYQNAPVQDAAYQNAPVQDAAYQSAPADDNNSAAEADDIIIPEIIPAEEAEAETEVGHFEDLPENPDPTADGTSTAEETSTTEETSTAEGTSTAEEKISTVAEEALTAAEEPSTPAETTAAEIPDQPVAPVCYLYRVRTGENTMVNTYPFLIGKGPDAGLDMSDTTVVSRRHALLTLQNGQFWLMDNNSKNHTYINGNMIIPGKPANLSNGDHIYVANEELIFQC